MNRIKPNTINKIWRLFLVLAFLLPSFTPVGTTDVQAGGIPFFGLIPAMIKRNKVYKSANSFIKDRADYYDTLRDTAAQQLLDREVGGLRDSQVAAYIKVVALIEGERDSMYDFAEGEKKEAREEFIDVLQDEITNVMLSTTPATRVLGAMTQGINSSQGFIEGILTKVTGGAGGVFEDLAKIRKVADRMTIAGQLIGGNVGQSIQKAGAKISDLASPTDSFEADLVKIQGELGALGGLVQGLQDRGYRPTASQTTGEVVIHLVTGEPANPSIEAIADMLVAKHSGQGNIRGRARDIMLGNAAARCRAQVEQIRQVIFRMEIDPVGETEDHPGMFPVCEQIDMTALVEEVAAAEPSPEGEEGETADANPAEGEENQSNQEDPPQPTDADSDSPEADLAQPGEFTSSSEYIWTLAKAEVNPNNAQTSFYGGGADPGYFTEARFEGKSLVFNCSAGSMSYTDVDVDHGYTYHNITLSANFDQPPANLDPGQEVTLQASASHSGSVNEGGAGGGLAFQYHLSNQSLDPVLAYHPWSVNFDGTSTGEWSFTVPSASEDGEFIITAGLWNSPPCHVVWTYTAQLNPNRSAEPEQQPAQESSSAPSQTEADPECAAMREEVAAKVPIARGADTADLALGIIGHLSAALGDIQVNYCEGGSGAAEKGTPIRVGDCVQTGANGRGKITFNDRDNKFNADPTSMFISRGSELCFRDFTVHRDDGKPGMIDHIKGYIRIITRGWQPGNSLGVNVSIRAAVTVASDIVLDYDPDLDLLRTYVNQGSVEVTDLQTGQNQQLTDNQLLITQGESIGSVERMSNKVWNDLLDDQGLEEIADDLIFQEGGSDLPQGVLIAISIVVIGGGITAGVLFYRKRKKEKV